MWKCPLTQSRSDCSPVEGAVPGHLAPPRRDETRDGQWLGVAVSSQGPGQLFYYFAAINQSLIKIDKNRVPISSALRYTS